MSLERKEELRTAGIVFAAIAGMIYGFWVMSYYEGPETSSATGGWIIKATILPFVVVFLSLFYLRLVVRNDYIISLFEWYTGGLELPFLLLAWRVLLHWYSNPDKPELEPLFVAVGVALAALEYGRKAMATYRDQRAQD